GCLERVCSTEFLRRRGVSSGTLFEHASQFGIDGRRDGTEKAGKVLGEVMEYLAAGISNAVNFVRPNRVVLTSELTRYPAFADTMQRSIRSRLLPELVKRVRIDLWDQADSHSAETAGWLSNSHSIRRSRELRRNLASFGDFAPIASSAPHRLHL